MTTTPTPPATPRRSRRQAVVSALAFTIVVASATAAVASGTGALDKALGHNTSQVGSFSAIDPDVATGPQVVYRDEYIVDPAAPTAGSAATPATPSAGSAATPATPSPNASGAALATPARGVSIPGGITRPAGTPVPSADPTPSTTTPRVDDGEDHEDEDHEDHEDEDHGSSGEHRNERGSWDDHDEDD